MSSYENVTENIKTASEAKPLSMTSAEHMLVARVAGIPKNEIRLHQLRLLYVIPKMHGYSGMIFSLQQLFSLL